MTFRTFFAGTAQREDGLSLIEVVITAFLVALIVIGTFTGFQDINRASADERAGNEAALLAAQAMEQLRSDPASTLNEIVGSAHTYTLKVDGNTYKITQEAAYFNESKPSSDCLATAATESSAKNDGDYLRATTTVTSPELEAAKRKPVSESSIITPPDGSALEVDATNGASPEAALSGVTATVKYTGTESTTATTLKGTTGTAGCIVFGGIPATSATVEIEELSGYVTTSGAVKVPSKEVTIAPNVTTHDPVVLNEGGAIKAKFTYTTKSKVVESVEGSTFVAYFEEGTSPTTEYTVGAPTLEYESGGEHKYKTVTTSATANYAHEATTPMGASYPKGDLFPFPYLSTTKKEWVVFAGDCKENNSHTIDSEVTDAKAVVLAGKTTEVSVPTADLTLDVYTGTSGTKAETKEPTVEITNTECAEAQTPANASAANFVHEQKLASTGHLKYPYQPFGKEKLCLVGESTTKTVSGKQVTEYHIQTVEPNITKTEHTDIVYLGETASYKPTGGEDEVTVTSSTTTKLSC